ncbi:MAG: hypothetical protein GY804_02435 [Alphaproteobacteria bacterium]|nr:hypothetical protein [Alphaproteobacteria bacterium]
MREIKFRAWDKIDKIMTEPRSLKQLLIQARDMQWEWEEGREIIMQYTGLKDKNGVEIFEGDIVEAHRFYTDFGENLGAFEAEEILNCVVKYLDDNMAFGLFPIKADDMCYIEPLSCSDEGIEVIGNIHENPELLEA